MMVDISSVMLAQVCFGKYFAARFFLRVSRSDGEHEESDNLNALCIMEGCTFSGHLEGDIMTKSVDGVTPKTLGIRCAMLGNDFPGRVIAPVFAFVVLHSKGTVCQWCSSGEVFDAFFRERRCQCLPVLASACQCCSP